MDKRPKRIAIVNSIVEHFDAISASVRDMYLAMTSSGHDVEVFCYNSDYDDIDVVRLNNSTDLLINKFFCDADLIVWHFGIYYEVFNTVIFGNGHAPRVICFHNITPEEYVPAASRPLIRRSLEQAQLLTHADEIWADSDVNAEMAIKLGVARPRVFHLPLLVGAPPLSTLASKARKKVEILYVGRFARSKGVLDLLKAYRGLCDSDAPPSRLTLAGNVAFSEQAYIEEIRNFIEDEGLQDSVEFAESVDDASLFALYRRSHILGIASYHEGFCKPVIEGLRAGCIPVGYRSYNVPYVVNGLGSLAEAGHIQDLSDRLRQMTSAVVEGLADPAAPILPLDRGPSSVAEFDLATVPHVGKFEPSTIRARMDERIAFLGGQQTREFGALA